MAGAAVEEPAVEGALDAGVVDYLSADAQVGAHVRAVGVECEDFWGCGRK